MATNTSLHPFQVLENVIFLKKAPIFEHVETGELQAVAHIVEEVRYTQGEIIVKEGDIGDSMFIIKEGTVSVTRQPAGKPAITLAKMDTGECFGDMAVFDAEVRSATVVALCDCTMLRISRDDLLEVLLEYPNISVSLLQVFIARLRIANTSIQDLSQGRNE